VVPGSHKLASRLESVLSRASRDANANAKADSMSSLAATKNVPIPPYSLFVGRGDLVHAGAGLSPSMKEPTARFHTYVVFKAKDAIQDRLFMYDFQGDSTLAEEAAEGSIDS
jgi:hypothetical protein